MKLKIGILGLLEAGCQHGSSVSPVRVHTYLLGNKKLKPDVLTDDHVPVAVAVEGSSEAEPVLNLLHPVDQIGRVGQVGVGMAAAEVLQDVGLEEALLGSAKLVPEDPFGIRSSHYEEKKSIYGQPNIRKLSGKKLI